MVQLPERIPGGAVDLSHLAAAPAPGGSAAAPSGGQIVDVPSLVVDVTDAMFEQISQLSSVVPVVIDLWAEWCQPCKTLGPILESLVREFAGQLLLAKVDVDANPGLAQAFGAQSIPTVVALVAGRPVPLFQGAMPEAQVREVFTQLVQLGAQQGLSGRLQAPDAASTDEARPAEEPVNPMHAEALDALERGDYEAAARAYDAVLLKSPADKEAHSALMQVRLLSRLQGMTVDTIRNTAAEQPQNMDAQMLVADLDVSGGACGRCLLAAARSLP